MPRPSRPTYAEIHLPALASNLQAIQRHVGNNVTVMAVVKANAYGHGLVPVSTYLERRGTKYFGVAFAEEGVALRNAGLRSPIQVFALSHGEQATLCVRDQLEPTVATVASVESIRAAAERARRYIDVHLKLETGMNRIGASPGELPAVLKAIQRSRRIRVKGVYTHLATADVADSRFVDVQLRRFQEGVEHIIRTGVYPEVIHAANSGAILHRTEATFTMVRAGILGYGYAPGFPESHRVKVRPALSLRTQVSQVKRITAGETVSYGRRYKARKGATVATIPIGYADGLFRSLSMKASVLLQGVRRPIIGTICMDQCMVDCGSLQVDVSDDVVIIGRQGSSTITAWDVARQAGTIPYEVTCAISARVPRVYFS